MPVCIYNTVGKAPVPAEGVLDGFVDDHLGRTSPIFEMPPQKGS